jgi:hypothetical protein
LLGFYVQVVISDCRAVIAADPDHYGVADLYARQLRTLRSGKLVYHAGEAALGKGGPRELF